MTRPLANITREDLEPLWSRRDIPTQKIADALGVTRQAVSYKAKALGLPSRVDNRLTYICDEKLTRMWLAGVSTKEIAAQFGNITRSAISLRRKKLGLPARTRSESGKARGGWPETITFTQFAEQELARKMQAMGAALVARKWL